MAEPSIGAHAEDTESIPESVASKIGAKLPEVLRYGYAGFLVGLMWSVYSPRQADVLFEKLKLPGTGVVIWLTGYGVFSFYRAMLNPIADFVSDSFYRPIQKASEIIARKKPLPRSTNWVNRLFRYVRLSRSKRQIIEGLGISWASSHEAFAVIRDSHFDASHQSKFYRQHTECHAVYLTGFIVLGAIFLGNWFGIEPDIVEVKYRQQLLTLMWCVGVTATCAGLYQDIRISIREALYLQTLLRDEKVKTTLEHLADS